MSRRLPTLFAVTTAAVLTAVGLAGPARAATVEQKLSTLSGWTQTSENSYNTWHNARSNQPAWATYAFDWSTDYCSNSPDNPLGFDFRLSCHRHDFGYRNYKAMSRFPANKARLDSAFYADLKRRCASYSTVLRPACDSLAWTYYQAVQAFGRILITQAEIDQAATLLPPG